MRPIWILCILLSNLKDLPIVNAVSIPNKRLLIGQDAGCETDVLKTYKSDVIIRSSSELFHDDSQHDYSASRGILDQTQTTTPDGVVHMGGWSSNFNDFNQFLEIEMQTEFNFTGVITQGKNGCCQEWVTKYRILSSRDAHCSSDSFSVLDSPDGALFQGNSDEDTKVEHAFSKPVIAKCIRVNPIRWNNHISMRIGLIGYPLNQANSQCSNQQAQQNTSTQSPQNAGGSYCQSSPCQNNGECHEVSNSFVCVCGMSSDGNYVFTGKRCELSLQVARTPQSTVPSTTWLHIPG